MAKDGFKKAGAILGIGAQLANSAMNGPSTLPNQYASHSKTQSQNISRQIDTGRKSQSSGQKSSYSQAFEIGQGKYPLPYFCAVFAPITIAKIPS